MVATAISPNVDNYYIGRGVVWWKPDGGSAFRDMGNATVFQFQANPKQLDHFTARTGLKTKDLSIVVEQNATIKLTLEEFTPDNLALAFMGIEPGSGSTTFNIMELGLVKGSLYFIGTNTIGAPLAVNVPIVTLTPSKAVDIIGTDVFGSIELTGDVLADPTSGFFGTVEWNTTLTAPP